MQHNDAKFFKSKNERTSINIMTV